MPNDQCPMTNDQRNPNARSPNERVGSNPRFLGIRILAFFGAWSFGFGHPRSLPAREDQGEGKRRELPSCVAEQFRNCRTQRVLRQSRRFPNVNEICWSFLLWLIGGCLFYVLSYGPAIWIEPQIDDNKTRSIMESAFVPASYVLFETSLRPFGVWYVSQWVPVHRS
jgi:hypothetical protein